MTRIASIFIEFVLKLNVKFHLRRMTITYFHQKQSEIKYYKQVQSQVMWYYDIQGQLMTMTIT